ncbi:MAG TPA: HAD family hydrolase, partial [archaeon]|nr:HAD family hydrolase [archaeon]
MSLPYLFLFDIDGTLLSTSGSGYRSFTRSYQEVLGLAGPLGSIPMAGKLDRMIFQKIAEHLRPDLAGGDLSVYWRRFREKYIKLLRTESRNPDGWFLYPGVKPLLEFCSSLGSLALLTGNVREGAYIKLSTLGIAEYFPTGGFGEECISRSQLAKLAFEEASRHFETEYTPERTFLFGDTVPDIQAG